MEHDLLVITTTGHTYYFNRSNFAMKNMLLLKYSVITVLIDEQDISVENEQNSKLQN